MPPSAGVPQAAINVTVVDLPLGAQNSDAGTSLPLSFDVGTNVFLN